MIDINELRLLVQDFKLVGSPVFVQAADMNELLDRIEKAEKERDALRAEIDALKAWKAAVEAQKPVGYWDPCDDMYFLPGFLLPHSEAKMEPRYACPVPAQSVPNFADALRPVITWLRNGCDPAKAADELELIVAKPAPSVPDRKD